MTARATGIERADLGVGPGEMSVQQVTGLPGAVGIDFLNGKLEDGLQAEKLVGAFRDGHRCPLTTRSSTTRSAGWRAGCHDASLCERRAGRDRQARVAGSREVLHPPPGLRKTAEERLVAVPG